MSISKNEHVKCSRCGKVSTLGQWNDLTYSRCVNREMRRAFTPLTEEKAFTRSADSFYECPECHEWNRGNHLSIVDTENSELLKLGGESFMKRI